MIGGSLVRASSARRLAMRALVILGAVFVGGQLMRSVPREQTLIFPVGSVFPNATRFAASWKQPGDEEPRGGVSLTFDHAPPLQIRQHAKVPNGDYIVTIDILQAPRATAAAAASATERPETTGALRKNAETSAETSSSGEGLQTNIERRVSLAGGEALIALAVVPREPSVSE